MEGLAQLEILCERLYNTKDPAERAHAQSTLQCFSSNAEYISQCQLILENSSSPYAMLLASSSLVKQVTDRNLALAVQLRADIKNYSLNYLATKAQELQPFVITTMIQLLCRITKLGWNEDGRFRDVPEEAMKFMTQGSVGHFYIGLKILNQLVTEFNQLNHGFTVTQHRKAACSFRDLALQSIFQISLSTLDQLKADNADKRLQEQAISLALRCLSFDFVASSQDESSEDLGTIQIPTTWRSILEDPSTMNIFFEYYSSTKPPLSNQALECLVRLASVRRTVFSGDAERIKFLAGIISGTLDILRTQKGLSEHENYHEYCRLLGRLKANYQLSELINLELYAEWIQLVAEFTIRSLQSWQWASGSIYYLLALWAKLVSSVPYTKTEALNRLDAFVPKITEAYITSRFDSVQNNLSEDPLDNEEALQDQFENLPQLFRFQYEQTSSFLLSLTDPILRAYTEASAISSPAESPRISIMEGQLSWLVYIIGSAVKARQAANNNAELNEQIDGELSARVFQLIKVCDSGSHSQRYRERSKQRLDVAILSFFQGFRRAHVADQAIQTSKSMYARLGELAGLPDNISVLNVVVTKLAADLKCYSESQEVIEKALLLFQDLASSGYACGKLLLKLDPIHFFLTNHTSEQFPFLNARCNLRNRTTFYFTIGRLMFLEENAVKFRTSIAPLQQTLLGLESTPPGAFRTEPVKNSLIGLFRDLRGIAMATTSKKTYGFVFDWLYPAHFPLVVQSAGLFVDSPEVINPLLKFMSELSHNKAQRLAFDASSPNGILLFREISKVLVAYGNGVLALPTTSDVYTCKYKGIWNALTMLLRALSGQYVNFGVFELYGDPALADAFDISLKMALSIPLTDVIAYRKLARAYFAFIENLCQGHISVLVNLDSANFAHFVGALETGLKSLDPGVSSQCAAAVDSLATYYFTNITLGEAPTNPNAMSLARQIQERPNIFPEILRTLFELILFEECPNVWSLGRPILSLLLLNEQVYNDIKIQIISSQPADQQQRLLLVFEKLMADVQRSLESRNRDKFSQNIQVFRSEFLSRPLPVPIVHHYGH